MKSKKETDNAQHGKLDNMIDKCKNMLNNNVTISEATFKTVTNDSKSSTWINPLNNSIMHNFVLNTLPMHSNNVPQNNQRTSDCQFVHKEYQNYNRVNISAATITPAQQTQMQTTNCALQDHVFYQPQYQQQVDYAPYRDNVSTQYQPQQNNPLMEQCNIPQVQTNNGFNDMNMFPQRQNINQSSSNFIHNTHNVPYWFLDNATEQVVEPIEYEFNMTYL